MKTTSRKKQHITADSSKQQQTAAHNSISLIFVLCFFKTKQGTDQAGSADQEMKETKGCRSLLCSLGLKQFWCFVLLSAALCCSLLLSAALCCSLLLSSALCCSLLLSAALYCSLLLSAALSAALCCCSGALCCSVLLSAALCSMLLSLVLSADLCAALSLLLSAAICCYLLCCSLISTFFFTDFFRPKLDIHALFSYFSDALSVSPLGQV